MPVVSGGVQDGAWCVRARHLSVAWPAPRRLPQVPGARRRRAAAARVPGAVTHIWDEHAAQLLVEIANAYDALTGTGNGPRDVARNAYWTQVAEDWAAINVQTDAVFNELEDVFFAKGGYSIPERERELVDSTGGSAAYGELEKTDELLRVLDMGVDDTFIDLGSGRGRVVLHAALKTDVGMALGVELSSLRHAIAEAALDALQQRGLHPGDRVELHCDDLMMADHIERATHVFLCNTCYTEALCSRIAERCLRSPRFKVLLTTRELPFQPWLRKVGEYVQEYSWTGAGRTYVYARDVSHVPRPLLAKLCCAPGVAWLSTSTLHGLQVLPLLEEGAWAKGPPFSTLDYQLPTLPQQMQSGKAGG